MHPQNSTIFGTYKLNNAELPTDSFIGKVVRTTFSENSEPV